MALSDLYYSGLVRIPHGFPLAPNPEPGGGVPQPKTGGNVVPGQLATKVEQALGLVAWGGTAAGVLGVLVTGAVMAISHKRGEGSEHMSRLGMVLGGCILVATAGPIVTWVFGNGGGTGGN
ncbi:hypothetical protein ACFFKH_09605 [Micromonospora marina]|uniref:Uncharacterized protein n=1 Tax=Micromonospora marina TaxID=307120 RepID=A0A1C4XBT0_9ACTN|nr:MULTISPECIES: hypothetical protein [Micromonospora]SCF05752.1 hypothetical protein GA0070215_10728 [Micromonospora marina]